VIVTPHVGGVTEQARREVSLMTVRNVLALLAGQEVNARYFARA
jgi:D-3-phosphoglycerate dehydrogenase